MAELVYAFDLKSNGAIRTGSSPVPATIFCFTKKLKKRDCGASRASPVPATKFVAKIAYLGVFSCLLYRNSASQEENTNLGDFS